jgi:hypothetical protein
MRVSHETTYTHLEIAEATGPAIYFGEPHSAVSTRHQRVVVPVPAPKGQDLSFYGPGTPGPSRTTG